jgi:hypothetical protein
MRSIQRVVTAGAAATALFWICVGPSSPMGVAPVLVAQETRDWSFPAEVNDDPHDARQTAPSVTEDGNGTLHVVWVDDRDNEGTEIYYSRLDRGAEHWTPNERVAPKGPGARRTDPDVAVDSLGAVHVVWQEYFDGDPEIYYSMRPATGGPWSLPERVNDDRGPGLQWSPVIAADTLGNVHVAWVDYREGTADIYSRRRDLGGEWSPSSRVNDRAEGDQRAPAIAASPHGDVFLAWLDTRERRPGIQASRLPPASLVWWPNARLTEYEQAAVDGAPGLAVDDSGQVHAVWPAREGGSSVIRAARLRPVGEGSAFWEPDRLAYTARNGAVLAVSADGGPGGHVLVSWSESRAAGSRIYAGLLPSSGLIEPWRLDGAQSVSDGAVPRALVDSRPRAHVVWQGIHRGSDTDVLYAFVDLEAPQRESADVGGWLTYVGRQPNCGTDVFRLIECDGTLGPSLIPRFPGVEVYLGSFVGLHGEVVAEGACPRIDGRAIWLVTSPCPRESGSVTGVMRSSDRTVENAKVFVDGDVVSTGPSGRFFAEDVAPGDHAITATMECALTSRLTDVPVRSGFNAIVPDGVLLRTDVVPDCKVDLHDLMRAAQSYKSRYPLVPPCADLDGDGVVSVFDLAIVSENYGRACPVPWQGGAGAVAGASTLSAPGGPLAPPGAVDPSDFSTSSGWSAVPGGTGRRALPGNTWHVLAEAASGVRGMVVEVGYGSDAPHDTDPGRDGIQPFDVSPLPAGVFVVENEARDGLATLAVVFPAPLSALSGTAPVAAMATSAEGALRLEGYTLAGGDGRVAGGRVSLVFSDAGALPPASRLRSWLPLALAGGRGTSIVESRWESSSHHAQGAPGDCHEASMSRSTVWSIPPLSR